MTYQIHQRDAELRGEARGEVKGEEKMLKLINALIKNGEMSKVSNVTSSASKREKMYEKYGIA